MSSDADSPGSYQRALALVERAWHTPEPFAARDLAQKALKICDYCPEAYSLLACLQSDPDESLELHRQAVEAAGRLVGPGFLEEMAGSLADSGPGRTYLSVRRGLAYHLFRRGRMGEAIEHGLALMRYDPTDRVEIRYALCSWLLAEGPEEEARRLLVHFRDDEDARLAYNRALLEYSRQRPESPAPLALLQMAQRMEPRIVPHLLGERSPYGGGLLYAEEEEEVEAARYAVEAGEAWERIPDALEWLQENREVSDRELRYEPARLVAVRNPSFESIPLAKYRAALEDRICQDAVEYGLEPEVFSYEDGTTIVTVTAPVGELSELVEGLAADEEISGLRIEVSRVRDGRLFDGMGLTIHLSEQRAEN